MPKSNLDKIKSGRIITDPEEMHRHFLAEERGMAKGHVSLTGDGVFLVKRGAAETVARARAKGATKGDGRPDEGELQRLAGQRGIDWEDGDATRTFSWWASDERVDSHGDIIRQDGWDFGLFKKNGPFLFGHRHHEMPIGRSLDWAIKGRATSDYDGPGLWLLQYFARGDDMADRALRLVTGGILTSGSVGLRPTELIFVEDEEERKALGLGRYGVVVAKAKLLEFSVVSLPANDGATVIRSLEAAKKSGSLKDAGDVELLRELARIECADNNRDLWRHIDDDFRGIGKTLFPDAVWKTHGDVEEPLIARGDAGMEFGDPEPTTLDKLSAEVASMRVLMGTVAADVSEMKDNAQGACPGCGDSSKSGKKEEGPDSRDDDAWNPYEGEGLD